MLGNKHEFQTLMILEYTNWIVSSKSVEKLYLLSKEFLVKNSAKYKNYNPKNFFSNISRRHDPLNSMP